jgi:hypothetical protein
MAKKKRCPRRARKKRSRRAATHKEGFRALREWFLPNGAIFAKIQRHGNTKWIPVQFVWLALIWAWSDARYLTDAFTEAVGICRPVFESDVLTTYQGFMGALVTWTPNYLPLLQGLLRRRMEQVGGKFWRIDGWVPIAFDGSRSTAPRTAANEVAYCAANYGRGKTAKYRKKKSKGMRRRNNERNKPQPQEPQAWITMLWHMGLRLPWDWRLGPSNSSERQHVMDMVNTGTFPEPTLFCGDAGFIGYALWASLLACGDFLVRVGANVHLLTEMAQCEMTKQGKDLLVLCWPKTVIRSGQRPLRLRLVQVPLGKTSAWMLTSVLDRRRLTAKQILRFYKMRWGVEVEYRGLKQTLDRAKLRCRNDRRLLVELDWSILAMAIAELFAIKEQLSKRRAKTRGCHQPPDPNRRSLAATMRALRACLRHLGEVAAPGKDLASLLAAALTDGYVRTRPKRARYRPPNPDKKPLGKPKLRRLTPGARARLKQLKLQNAA